MAPRRQRVLALWPMLQGPSHRLPPCSHHVPTGKLPGLQAAGQGPMAPCKALGHRPASLGLGQPHAAGMPSLVPLTDF